MEYKHFILALVISSLVLGCATKPDSTVATQNKDSANVDDLFPVDCLLPGRIHKLGGKLTFLTQRQPVKVTATQCEIRGGEYVAYDRASYATSLKVWLPQAQDGDAEAQVYVGEIYEKGLGLPPDYQAAAEWYKKAAEQGNSRAQINLGFLYEKGLGVPQDSVKAMEWYRKSSGLAATDIAYATTLETVPAGDDNDQVKLLETELNNSRNEAKILSEQLEKTQQQLETSRQTINKSNSQLNKAKLQLNNTAVQTDDAEKRRLQNIVHKNEREINQQKENLETLENQYQNKVAALTYKLEETEKRAKQISSDVKTHKTAANETQLKLLDNQAQLANTEKRLLQLKSELQVAADAETLSQDQQVALDATQQDIQNLEQIVKDRENEKQQQQMLIAQLEKQNREDKENIEKLQLQLQSSVVSAEQGAQLQQELHMQNQAAEQTRQKLQLTQDQLSDTEKKLADLENQYVAERDKLNVIALNQSQKDNALIKQQQQKISKLELEKQQYEKKISKLQAKYDGPEEKPKIVIIEPPVVFKVRSVPTVTLRSVLMQGNIVGKVVTHSGLLSLAVNDKKYTVDDLGIFQASVALAPEETPVEVVAIDKKGRRSTLEFKFSLSKRTASSSGSEHQQVARSQDFGNYYALIIGNSKYQKIPALDTPVNDAKAVEKVLRQQYGFKTKLLINSTRYQILSELNKLRGELNENDNLMIYYAGHGELDKKNMRGHWLPIDADADNTANWISTVALTDILNVMTAKHIMVVADSCYSGAMTRSSLARLEPGISDKKKSEWLKAMIKARSRTILTSGGLKPVMDGGGGEHSVFARAFIEALRNNKSILEGQMLYRNVSKGIVAIAAQYGIEQVPVYAPIRLSGHENGEFFFVPI